MISKELLVLGLILIAVNSGAALYCYGCVGSTTSDCFEGDTNSYILQDCQALATYVSPVPSVRHIINLNSTNEAPIEVVCIQFTQSDATPKVFTRGCGYIYENVDICEYLHNITDIEGCSNCRHDLCNSQPGTLDP